MKAKTPAAVKRPNEAPFAYEGLDRVIHERARLSVLTSLVTHPKGLTFGDLKELCALTDGNLSRHLRVLENAKLVEILKGHERNRPLTICRITSSGRKRYIEYLSTLEQVVRDAARGTKEVPASLVRGPLDGRETHRSLRAGPAHDHSRAFLSADWLTIEPAEPRTSSKEISNHVGGQQTFLGPTLAIPYNIPPAIAGGLCKARHLPRLSRTSLGGSEDYN
jgi:DNA-binding transcriptional ArsR family regulator